MAKQKLRRHKITDLEVVCHPGYKGVPLGRTYIGPWCASVAGKPLHQLSEAEIKKYAKANGLDAASLIAACTVERANWSAIMDHNRRAFARFGSAPTSVVFKQKRTKHQIAVSAERR